ncbi:MAG TPA: ATP-binding cassette domain-containing protein [Polyangiales bacterium]|nr:ATP-binding cassette domain-containing protein [Polyangiales bacterium]
MDEPNTARGARVELRNVSVKRGARTVVDSVSLIVEPSELLVLIGPSGAGKSTLLSTLNRLIEPSSGDVLIDGRAVSARRPHELRRSIGYCFQALGLVPHLSVGENIAITPRLLGWNESRIDQRVSELLERVGLDPSFCARLPRQLSGGQAQRVAVARALAANPPLLLLDEPFGALDPNTRSLLQEEVRSLQASLGTTTLFVSHDLSEALLLADKIAVLVDGRLVQLGAPREIIDHPVSEDVSRLTEPALRRARALCSLEEDA